MRPTRTPVLVHLATAQSAFHARVIAARLGADGIVTELRGALDGPYPVGGEVQVLVRVEDLETARDLLLADRVEAEADEPAGDDVARFGRCHWIALAALVVVLFALAVRSVLGVLG